jgi:hypothetical protein
LAASSTKTLSRALITAVRFVFDRGKKIAFRSL